MRKTTGKGEENPLCQKLVQEGRDATIYMGV